MWRHRRNYGGDFTDLVFRWALQRAGEFQNPRMVAMPLSLTLFRKNVPENILAALADPPGPPATLTSPAGCARLSSARPP